VFIYVYIYDETPSPFHTQADTEPNFCFFDFHDPAALPADLIGAFRCVVMDPPFITHDVWRLYAATARRLLAPNTAG